jgi:hypothetical protein
VVLLRGGVDLVHRLQDGKHAVHLPRHQLLDFLLMDSEHQQSYHQVAGPIDAPRVISRRAALIGLGSATAGLLGVLADRTLFGGAPASTPTASTAPVLRADDRLFVNLRPVKPYDWVEEPFMGLGGRNPVAASDGAFVWSLSFEREKPTVAAAAVEIMAVATPAAIGDIRDLTIETPRPMLFERMRDMGTPADVAQVEAANGHPPVVGDLWVILPRDEPWPAGHYTITAVTALRSYVFTFNLT